MNPAIKIGEYQLNYRPVELFLDPDSSAGEGWPCPDKVGDKIPMSRIIVGIKHVPLWGAWGTLVHEAVEMSLVDHRVCYHTASVFHNSTEERAFFFEHRVLTRMCDDVGFFLCKCRRDFERTYAKAVRKKRNKETKK